jgi:hypothetical protein
MIRYVFWSFARAGALPDGVLAFVGAVIVLVAQRKVWAYT